jgi:hypothetical protein
MDTETKSVDTQAKDMVERRARETITDLKAGKVGDLTVKDLHEAVNQATRDAGVRRATSRSL